MAYSYSFLLLAFGFIVYFSIESTMVPPKLACYYLIWPRYYKSPMSYRPENIPVELCDELVYYFANLNETTFDIDYDDYHAGIELGDIYNITKLSPKIYKMIIAIGGWEKTLGGFSALSAPENRRAFVSNAIKFMQSHNFRGLLIDWSYPGKTNKSDPTDKTTYVELVKDLRAEFRKLKFKLAITGPNSLHFLSNGYNVPELSKYVDSIHVKSYEMWGSWERTAYPQNPLYQVSRNTNKKYSVKTAMDLWVSLGAPKKKLFVGMSLFGTTLRLSAGADGGLGSPIDGQGSEEMYTRNEGEITYYELCAKLMSGGSWSDKWEKEGLVPYAFDLADDRKWVTYENPKSAFEKGKYVLRERFGGMFVYGVSIDDFRGLCGPKYAITKAARSAWMNGTL